MKPKRGKDSCKSVYYEKNFDVASCLGAKHATDWSADSSNGVLVIDDEHTDTDTQRNRQRF